MDLAQLRKEIDHIDDQVMDLLIQRFHLVNQVKEYKKTHQIPVLDATREQEIYQKIQAHAFPKALTAIYDTLLKVSKQLQE